MLADLKFRLRALLRRDVMERELDTELRFHLEQEIEKHVRAGMPRADAERAARIAFGGVERIKDDTRDAHGISGWDTFSQDLRYAWRGLRSRPGFALAIITTLALGIGANAAMFGIVDRVLFRPPAYLKEMDRTHRVFLSFWWDNDQRTDRHFAYRRFLDLKQNTTSFETMAAFGSREIAIGTGLETRQATVAVASATLFDFFDARPALGRFFSPAEDTTPAGEMVAVLGHAYWQSRYGGRADALGEKLHIGSQIYTVIGVAPEDFIGLAEEGVPVAFLPITSFASARGNGYFQTYNWSWAEIVMRRKPGVSIETATADLPLAYGRSWDAAPTTWGITNRKNPTAAEVRAQGRLESVLLARGPDANASARVAAWVMGVTVIVLLIACANVANLLLGRALARRREITLRLALGVSRRRLYQQLATESTLVALLGGAAGILLAQFGGHALRTFFLTPGQTPDTLTDARTLLFTGAITAVVAVLTGLAPALHALRTDLAAALKSGAREGTYRRSRTRSALLVIQGALSVVLLVGAGLFVRSLSNVRSMDLGWDPEPVVLVQGVPRGARLSLQENNALLDRLVAEAGRLPGVEHVTRSASVPFYSFEGRGAPIVAGRDSLNKLGGYSLQIGDESYFATMGTGIVRGRGILATDREGTPIVAVVSEEMARAIWPAEDAIGKQFRLPGKDMPLITVVGVAEDMRAGRLRGKPEMWYYLPAEQYNVLFKEPLSLQVLVRVAGRADDHLEGIRRALQPQMPGEGYVTTLAMRSILAPEQRSWEFGATMFAVFGALALVLAAIGLYSVIAYGVAQRSHELGVRIALGASVRDVVTMVLRQGLAFALAGIVIGGVAALWAGRFVEPLLFEQTAKDPAVFGAVALVLVIVAVAATLRPAIRATRVDPTITLRAD
jgi:putative ABC transport system permease protein